MSTECELIKQMLFNPQAGTALDLSLALSLGDDWQSEKTRANKESWSGGNSRGANWSLMTSDSPHRKTSNRAEEFQPLLAAKLDGVIQTNLT